MGGMNICVLFCHLSATNIYGQTQTSWLFNQCPEIVSMKLDYEKVFFFYFFSLKCSCYIVSNFLFMEFCDTKCLETEIDSCSVFISFSWCFCVWLFNRKSMCFYSNKCHIYFCFYIFSSFLFYFSFHEGWNLSSFYDAKWRPYHGWFSTIKLVPHIHLSFSMDSSKVSTGMRSLVQKSMDKITKLEEKSTCFFYHKQSCPFMFWQEISLFYNLIKLINPTSIKG